MTGRRLTGGLGVLAAVAAALVATPAAQAEPPGQPLLRLEAGAHAGPVNRIAFLPSGQVVTASDDQTVRLWQPADGAPGEVIRGPAGPGDEGAVYAVAAGARLLATGGRAGWDWDRATVVRLLDAATGAPRGALSGLSAPVAALAFSPDESRLAVGLFGRLSGLRVFDMASGRAVLTDADFRGGLTDLAFLDAGRLAAVDEAGEVHLYGLTGGPARILPAGAGARPWRLAAAPGGDHVAVGLRDRPEVALLDLTSGSERRLAVPGLASGGLPVVAWSPDGGLVYAAGPRGGGSADYAVHAWTAADGSYRGAWPVGPVTVTALAVGPDGGVYVGDASGALTRLERGGHEAFRRTTAAPSLRGLSYSPLAVSRDGAAISFTLDTSGSRRAAFSLADRRLVPAVDGPETSPRTRTAGATAVAVDLAAGAATLGGRPIALAAGERALDAAVSPQGDLALVSTNFHLRAYRGGQEVWRQPLPAAGWGVAASGDGRVVVTARGDGVIDWRRAADGSLLVSLFATADLRHWVLWTPDGFFDHSPADSRGISGAHMIGYQINEGYRNAARFLPIDRMYRRYYRSDVVSAAFRDGPGDRAIVAAALQGPTPTAAETVAAGRPPAVKLDEICVVDEFDTAAGCLTPSVAGNTRASLPRVTAGARGPGEVELIMTVEDGGSGVGQIEVRRNGARVATRDAGAVVTGKQHAFRRRVPLVPGLNEIEVVAFDGGQQVASAPASIRVEGPPAAAAERAVHVLAVGISDYAVDLFDLREGIAANDARAIAAAFEDAANRRKVFDKAETEVLLEAEATAEGIDAALQRIAARSRPTDTVVVFFSGHGEVIDGDYHFAPHGMGSSSLQLLHEAQKGVRFGDSTVREIYRREGVAQSRLTELLAGVNAERVILMLDTCYAGSFSLLDTTQRADLSSTVAERVARDSGRFILASARGLANDDDGKDYPEGVGHGLFTSALLEALSGAADGDSDSEISMPEAGAYVKRRVVEISQNWETPQTPVARFLGDPFFPIIDVPQSP